MCPGAESVLGDPEGFAWLENHGLRQLADKRSLQLVSRCDAILRSSRFGVSAQMLADVRCEILAEAMHAATSVDQDLHSDRVRAGTEPVTRLRQGLKLAAACAKKRPAHAAFRS
jgi:hypothetical protein